MVKALPNTSFLPVPKSAPAGHTTAAAHLLWQVFPRYPCLEYKDNSGQSCPVRYTWTASFGRGLMFWQKWFNLTPQFVAYQFPGHLLHPHWYFTAYSSICQVLLGALKQKFASVATLAVLALRSFPCKYNVGNTFIYPQNLDFPKRKERQSRPEKRKQRMLSHILRFYR